MIKLNLGRYAYIFGVVTALTTIIIPSILYFSVISNIVPYEYIYVFLTKITQLFIVSISIGFFTSSATFIAFYYESFSFRRVIFLIIAEILYLVDIIVWSRIGSLSIKTTNSYTFLDQSILYYYFLGIPILLIIRSIYNFKYARDKWKDYYFVLKAIFINKNMHNSSQINKYIRALNLENDLITKIVKNTTTYIKTFKDLGIVKRSENYRLTTKGKKLLNKLEKIKLYQDINHAFFEFKEIKLEVWTKEDLKKLRRI